MSHHGPPPPSPLPPERRFPERRLEGPRRVKGGLKLSRDEAVARNALALKWMGLVESHVSPETLHEGLMYAQAGQVISLQVLSGAIESQVQGTAPRPYVVRVTVPVLSEQQWQGVIDAMAREAIHVAKLLGGELPPGVDEVFDSQDASLLPRTLSSTCRCAADAAGRCKHVAAVAHLVADRLSDEPLLILSLLGLPAERLLERLRHARTLHTHGVAVAHGEAPILEGQAPAAPLESLLDDFWRGSGEIDTIDWKPPETVPHALLRRLGPSPIAGKFPMVGLLASIYDTVADAARRKGV